MEKFSLKWNDFQLNASKSFKILRKEKEFFDVTLVSDDEVQISAHKVILSACSSFFKSILKNNPHSHPLLYLGGVNSENLSFIMDYIYQGEVQIYQSNLNSFLEAAQKLKIDGLLSDIDYEVKSELKDTHYDYYDDNSFVGDQEEFKNQRNTREVANIQIDNGDHEAAKQKAEEMIQKIDGGFECTACLKTGKSRWDMVRHAETHIEGVSYPCQKCDKSFRSENSLSNHKSTKHRS